MFSDFLQLTSRLIRQQKTRIHKLPYIRQRPRRLFWLSRSGVRNQKSVFPINGTTAPPNFFLLFFSASFSSSYSHCCLCDRSCSFSRWLDPVMLSQAPGSRACRFLATPVHSSSVFASSSTSWPHRSNHCQRPWPPTSTPATSEVIKSL